MILNPNGDFPYTHRIYFAVGLLSIYLTEAEALSALQAYDPPEWIIQSADLLGDPTNPKRGRMKRNAASWYVAFPYERDPNRVYPFAGGFEDRAELERWTPFVEAIHTMLQVAKCWQAGWSIPRSGGPGAEFQGAEPRCDDQVESAAVRTY